MCPDGDPTERTRRAYDGAAEAFRERTADRSRMDPVATAFAAEVAPGGLVLDLGCGPGHDRPLLESRGLRVVGLDLSSSMLGLARRAHPGPYVQGDVGRLPLRGPLDGIWANASLLHVPRARIAGVLAALVGVLRPRAPLFVSCKRGVGEGMEECSAYAGMGPRWFTYWQPRELDATLRAAGLAIVFSTEQAAREKEWLVRIGRR